MVLVYMRRIDVERTNLIKEYISIHVRYSYAVLSIGPNIQGHHVHIPSSIYPHSNIAVGELEVTYCNQKAVEKLYSCIDRCPNGGEADIYQYIYIDRYNGWSIYQIEEDRID